MANRKYPNPKSLANLRPPWKKGEKGGGAPPRRAEASIIEHVNGLLSDPETNDGTLYAIIKGRYHPALKMAAAQIVLGRELPDIADYEPVMRGEKSLEQLRSMGISTFAVRKVKTRTINGRDGSVTVEREIELYDRSGSAFDRVLDRQIGKPTQTIQANVTEVELDPQALLAAASGSDKGRQAALLSAEAVLDVMLMGDGTPRS